MKVSIITVCYNAEKTIRDTIESVLMQTYTDFEYIIQDGLSKDQTMEIVEEYAPKFAQKGIPYRYESCKDAGIYNAMNKATQKANGEWCEYMNADDSFYSESVLQEIFGTESYEEYSAVFGGYCRHDERNSYVFQSEEIDILPRKMPFVHQTIFVRTDVFKKYKYDESYKLCADYDVFFRMYADGHQFKRVDVIVANYSISGISGSRNIQALDETILIREKHRAQFPISNGSRMKWKYMRSMMYIKRLVPKSVIRRLRQWKAYVRVQLLHKKTT